jgi:hypothetical protein
MKQLSSNLVRAILWSVLPSVLRSVLVLALGVAPAAAAPLLDKEPPAVAKPEPPPKADERPVKPEDSPAKSEAPARNNLKEMMSKEVILTGTLGCGKCSMHLTKSCQNVLKVKHGSKEDVYFLAANAVSEANHEKVCGSTSPATVTGLVTQKGGQKILTASAIKFN